MNLEQKDGDAHRFQSPAAEDEAFIAVLEHVAPFDAFSHNNAPSIFIVYAHDNCQHAEPAHASRVHCLIDWLRVIRSNSLSDKSPLPLYATRDTGDDAVRNIISNQTCLLPRTRNPFSHDSIVQSVDKVIVCGSELLEKYYNDSFTSPYLKEIETAYDAADTRQHKIRIVVDKCAERPGFHNVLTELAFLRLRDPSKHGIIPISLDESNFTYLPFPDSAELRLMAKPGQSGLRNLFFKLLLHIYPQEQELVHTFRDSYAKACKRFEQNGIVPKDVQQIIKEELQKADTVWYGHISGLGGVGKTQVAQQIAHWAGKNESDWSLLWLPVTSRESFEQACVEVARLLGTKDPNASDAKQVVRDYLQQPSSGRWLLIVDNADDEDMVFGDSTGSEGICEFLPRSTSGRILLTTRRQQIATRFARTAVVKIEAMPQSEALVLLEKSLIDQHYLENQTVVIKLLEDLEYLPLTISHAAAYINTNSISIQEYIGLFHNTERDLKELLGTLFDDDTPYRRPRISVATSWMVSFNEIRKNVNASALLLFIAHIEPKAIPRSVLPAMETEQRMTEAIGLLRGYSFLSEHERGGLYDMHRLVHKVSRLWVKEQSDAVHQRNLALRQLRTTFRTCDWKDREMWRRSLPHVLKAIEHRDGDDNRSTRAEEVCRWSEPECQLGFTAGLCMMTDGRCQEAAALLERVVAGRKRYLPEPHPALLWSQHELARAYEADMRHGEAIDLLEHVVSIRKRELDEFDSALLWSQHELGRAYKACNRCSKAVPLLEQVVKGRKATTNETSRERLLAQHELGMAYMDSGRVKTSIELFKQTLATYEQSTDEKDSGRLWTQLELARAYAADGRCKDAIPLLQTVVSIRRETLPESHAHRLQSEHTLALALLQDKRVDEAVALLEQAVQVYQRTLASSHPIRCNIERNLRLAYARRN
ncbi:hypothetical protein H9Q69_009946 [Fusarium xylarioides]|nr:hypothetical protein H9Q69_009946 [Fusarium xylarioides]